MLKKLILISGMLIMSSTIARAAGNAERPLRVVPSIDLARYAGRWYEIARLPNRFQKKCAGDVTATYSLLEDDGLRVINQCRKENGETTRAEGVARMASKRGPNTKLKVRFAPAFLSFLPFVWGDYWIIELAEDYSHAVIGDPDRKYLWILSRTPEMDDSVFQKLVGHATAQGYDLSGLTRTRQTASPSSE
jgi:apolipoprotein D and lipocalin family protein